MHEAFAVSVQVAAPEQPPAQVPAAQENWTLLPEAAPDAGKTVPPVMEGLNATDKEVQPAMELPAVVPQLQLTVYAPP